MSKRRKPRAVPVPLAGDEVLLALDISSRAVGWAVFRNGELSHYDKWVLPHLKGHGCRLCVFREDLLRAFAEYNPTAVYWEAPYQGRARHAFAVLSAYVGMLKATYYEWAGTDIDEEHGIPAHLVKRRIGARRGRSHEENKRIVVTLVNEQFGLSLRYKADDARKTISDDDVADAIAVGWAALLGRTGTEPEDAEEGADDGLAGGRRTQRRVRRTSPRKTRSRGARGS